MVCPKSKVAIIKQFNDDPDKVWDDYAANNPGLSEVHLSMYFDGLYSHCFSKHAPEHSLSTSFELPQNVRDAITQCVTTTKVPV